MDIYEYGSLRSDTVLIRMTDDHEIGSLEDEIRIISEKTEKDFKLTAVKTENWNHDLSPWKAPAVFGNEDFGGGAEKTLEYVLSLCSDPKKTYYIGGYSLAGLFALWAAYQTDRFSGVAAASPSVWFPGFTGYIKTHDIRTERVYLSLGDKEDKTRNPVMATVKDRITETEQIIRASGTDTFLEWNEGNHFKDPHIRTAKAFARIMNRNLLRIR